LLRYTTRDISLSEEGDMELDQTGDLELSTPTETVQQAAMSRIKTNNPDWFRFPRIGADLEDLFGEDNDWSTAQDAEVKAENALTIDGRFSDNDVNVDPVPTAPGILELFIFINTGAEEILAGKYPIELR